MKKRSVASRITYIITVIILCILLYYVYGYYQENNFNNFMRSEAKPYTSEFKRDKEVKYNDKSSYKIKSNEYNDAMFYEKIQIEKGMPYKVTCMVKTEDVTPETEQSNIGAQISIEGRIRKISCNSRNI